jgi:DNA-binding transcriptional MerR regulator
VHTIRWYEAQGLMPGVLRDGGRRRVYTPDHVLWLELVHRLRLTGMTVAEIRAYARIVQEGRAGRPRLREILASHAARTQEKIEQQREALSFIQRKIRFYDEWIASGTRPAIPNPPRSRR